MKKHLLFLVFLFSPYNLFSHNPDTQHPLTDALWIFMKDADLPVKRKISLLDGIVIGAVTINGTNVVFQDIFDPKITYEDDVTILNDFVEMLKSSSAIWYEMKILQEVKHAQHLGKQEYIDALEKIFSPDGIFEMTLERFALIIINCPSPEDSNLFDLIRQRKELLTTLYNRNKNDFIQMFGDVSVDEALETINKRISTVYNLKQAIITSKPEAINNACKELITLESVLLIDEFKGIEEDIQKLESN